jgi:hypothetical protein
MPIPAPPNGLAPPRQLKEVPNMVQPAANSIEAQMPGVTSDPGNISSLQKQADIINGQGLADSLYDPPVPPPEKTIKSGFTDMRAGIANDNLITRICCFIAGLLIIILICYTIKCGGFSNMFKARGRGLTSLFKMPVLFR